MKRQIFAGLFALAAMPAQAAVLDFSGDACTGLKACPTRNAYIDQSYGDLTGVDIIYDSGVSGSRIGPLSHYRSGYSDLTDVAYVVQRSSIEFKALSNSSVSLFGFDLGNYLGFAYQAGFAITDLATDEEVFNSGFVTLDPEVRSSFSFDVSSSVGLSLHFLEEGGRGFGIDNIVYDVQLADGSEPVPAPVPLPATGLLLGGALLGFGAWRRKG